MYHPYKAVLAAVGFLLPLLVLALGNRFDSRRRTLGRAALAVAVGWAWLVAAALLVTEIDMRLADSPERLQEIVDGDGGRHVGALFLGWAPALILVLCYWGVIRGVLALRRRPACR